MTTKKQVRLPVLALRLAQVSMTLVLVFVVYQLGFLVDVTVHSPGDRWQDVFRTPAQRETLRIEWEAWKADKAFLVTLGDPIATICVSSRKWETVPSRQREEFYKIMASIGRQRVGGDGCVAVYTDRYLKWWSQ